MRVFRNRKQGVPHRWELSSNSCTVVSAVQMYRQYLSGLPNLPSNTGGVQRRVRFGKPDIPPAADIIGTDIRVQTNMKRGWKRLVEPGAAQHPEKRKEYFGSMCDKKQTEKNRFEEQLTILETVIQDLRDVKNLPDILRRLNSLQREVFKEIGQKRAVS